jgi:hypothetical protein
LKYKRCYGIGSKSCAIFQADKRKRLLSENDASEKQVFNFFNDAVNEVKTVFAKGCESYVSPRIQMIDAYTLAEVFASYWAVYAATGIIGPNERLKDWYRTFCSVAENQTYISRRQFKKMNDVRAVAQRNALIHFYGMSENVAIASSNMDDDTFNKYERRFKTSVAVFRTVDFYDLFRDGAVLMLTRIRENIKIAATDKKAEMAHLEGIARLLRKFQLEGGVQMPIPKEN